MTNPPNPALRQLAANTIRALAIDATNAADSGHPGAPMGLADIAVVLWGEFLRFDPSAPSWPDRDRFILSNGHASMLLYSMLHLTGYDLSIDELKHFRQLGSKTPGHPEHGLTPGVETTTGPLGQGFANGVGMAIAARMAKARLPGKGGFEPLTHRIFGICGDGCLMEGVTSEAASTAGHLKLGEIVYFYDDNHITIDGKTEITFSEDVEKRFQAYHWHTLRIDGHDPEQIRAAIQAGIAEKERPTLILARTHIGFGSPNRQDSSKAHGEPLGEEEGKLAKAKLGWDRPPFDVPAEVRAYFEQAASRGKAAHAEWQKGLANWKKADAQLGALWDKLSSRSADGDVAAAVVKATGNDVNATRNLSQKSIIALAERMPSLVGGSADLEGSTKTGIKGSPYLGPNPETWTARNLHFGVREHGMGSIVNGMALYGFFVPFGATFLTFADYMRPALRLAALMKIRALTVFTHDSIYLGEDGPTHQAVEQLWALRVIPGMTVWRPADGLETAMAWVYAATKGPDGPHCFSLTRQNIDVIERPKDFDPSIILKGGYVAVDADKPDFAIIATGSEVGVAANAVKLLAKDGIPGRVVSMPALEVFLAQDEAYRKQVLPPGLKLASFELGRTAPWKMLTGLDGLNIGIDTFGESAPWKKLRDHFHVGAEDVAKRLRAWLGK